MPNARDPKKKMLGFWFAPDEIQQLDELAKRSGTNRAEIVKALVRNQYNPMPNFSKTKFN